MKLRANAVEFVFHVGRMGLMGLIREPGPDRFCRGLRAREHAFDRAEQRQLRPLQLALQCEQRRAPDVAEKHVRFFHVIERSVESGRDRFFDETLAQTDPEIAGQNLDDILAFARRDFRETFLQNLRLGQWAARFLERIKKLA